MKIILLITFILCTWTTLCKGDKNIIQNIFYDDNNSVWNSVAIGGGGYVIGLVPHPKQQGLVKYKKKKKKFFKLIVISFYFYFYIYAYILYK